MSTRRRAFQTTALPSGCAPLYKRGVAYLLANEVDPSGKNAEVGDTYLKAKVRLRRRDLQIDALTNEILDSNDREVISHLRKFLEYLQDDLKRRRSK